MKIVLLGGGGHASDTLGVIEALNKLPNVHFDVVAIADDQWERKDRFQNRNMNLILGLKNAYKLGTYFIATIGYPVERRIVAEDAIEKSSLVACTPIIHPTTHTGTLVEIGVGTVILGMASINSLVKIDEHCYLSHGVLIGHDVEISKFTSIMPGASISGDVVIGEGVLIGAGAVVLEKLKIGNNAIVGAGAVVTKDVNDNEVVMGVPAKAKRCDIHENNY